MKLSSVLAAAVFALAASSASAEDLKFDLKNGTSAVLDQFYASPPDTNDWEDDILGQDVLDKGETVTVTVADGRDTCVYDLRFVFQDGDVIEKAKVDLCKQKNFTLHE